MQLVSQQLPAVCGVHTASAGDAAWVAAVFLVSGLASVDVALVRGGMML
jgi:hypothetical protein